MSGPIKKGDLVMVVKPTPCCGNHSATGRVYRVMDVKAGGRYCRYCRKPHQEPSAIQPNGRGIALRRLKKIDPPATGEYDRVPVRKAQPKKVPA